MHTEVQVANDISARPWFIDTAGAGIIYQPQEFIKFIEVVGGAGGALGGVMADIRDRNNKSIVMALYQTVNAGEIQTYNLENWFEGLIVAVLGAGVTLRLHVK
jgi:hypothetical protein